MNHIRVCRSALYTPGANPAVLLKAARSEADILIFDLEDAVAPESKLDARTHVLNALADPALKDRKIVVRVNGLGTPWGRDDVHAVAKAGAFGLLFPKINGEDDVRAAEREMTAAGAPAEMALWCMVETPTAFLDARAIGRMRQQPQSRMTTWVLGTNDLVKDLRARHTPGRENLVPMLTMALLAAREAGLCLLDGVHNDVKDTEAFDRACAQARDMGFDGKTLIHPTQVAGCHRAFSPTEAEVADAQKVLNAFALPENQGRGVLQIDGRMVELLHAQIARETVAMAQAIGMVPLTPADSQPT